MLELWHPPPPPEPPKPPVTPTAFAELNCPPPPLPPYAVKLNAFLVIVLELPVPPEVAELPVPPVPTKIV